MGRSSNKHSTGTGTKSPRTINQAQSAVKSIHDHHVNNSSLDAPASLPTWNAIIGLRNRLVHDYMNIDMDQVTALLNADKDQFVVRFLLREFRRRGHTGALKKSVAQ